MLVVFVLILIAGLLYQSTSEARDGRAHPMPGDLIDVGGYKMHLDCMGQGSPTVILDAGLGDNYTSWRKVQPQISQITRVCSYDRAGAGYSQPSPRSRTARDFAEELHALLHKAAIASPVILVGHSMSGYTVRIYNQLYPGEVAGIVLVDASHPEQQTRLPPTLNDIDAGWIREQEFLEFAMPFGIPRALGFCGGDAEVRAAECNFHSVHESIAELKAISQSAAQASATGSLGDLPLIVLSGDPAVPEPDIPEDLVKPTSDAWQQMQKELAQLSTRSIQVTAKNSGHYIQFDRADLVVNAVRSVVAQVRRAQTTTNPTP